TDLKSILNLILQINDLVMPIYLFLDEIQAAEAWDKTLKFFYDHHRGKIKKIVATGSSAAELIKGSQESGIGRWEEIDISTVSFHEYFENFINILDGENITREFEPLGEKLNSIEEIFNLRLSEAAEKSLLKFNDALYDYSIFGGFPELIPIKSEKDAQSVIRRDILDRTLNRDMVQIYNIRQPKEIEKLYFYICSNAGSETALTKLANILSVDNNTIKRYISQLKESRLIHNIPKWSKKQIPRGHEKIYPIDASIRNALLAKSKKDLISNPIDFGYVAELLAVTHTSRWAKYHSYSLQHYREQKKEIDIIVKEGNEVYPIEVKFQENIEIRDVLKNFDAFYEKNRFEKAFIINKGPDINGKIEIQKRKYELYVYPLWFYLTIISV
ncbi:MAG: DUF4143 domain-containing protein, partial [Spirochaetota bacterium]|nr:DUF4143 domain-containing protein [Spirochaetota bacterium]